MRNKLIYLSVLFLTLFAVRASAQHKKVDSLLLLLKQAKEDTAKLSLYYNLGKFCDSEDNLKYAVPMIDLVNKLLPAIKDSTERYMVLKRKAEAYNLFQVYYQEKEGKGGTAKAEEYLKKKAIVFYDINDLEDFKIAMMDLADMYEAKGDIMGRLEVLKEGIAMSEKKKYWNGMSRFTTQMAFLYGGQGDTTQAKVYLEKASGYEKKIGDTTRLTRGYFLKGVFYATIGCRDLAIVNYNIAADRYKRQKDTLSVIETYTRVGEVYTDMGEFGKAREILLNCVEMARQKQDDGKMFFSLITLGDVYQREKQPGEALQYHQKALRLAEEAKNDFAVAHACRALSRDYFLLGNYKNAKMNSDRSLNLIKEGGSVQDLLDRERTAYKIDSALGNGGEAFRHYQQFVLLGQKMNIEEIHKAAAKEKFQNDIENQQKQSQAEQERRDLLNAKEKEGQRLVIYFISFGLLLVLIFGLYMLKAYRQKRKDNLIIVEQKKDVEKAKIIIEEKQHEILDSINYAQRIQQAMLPPLSDIALALPHSFVLFKPKDIVSGDFYWFDQKDNKIFIAAADCTGHGVQGAIMSMLGAERLNEALVHSSDVSGILPLLNKGVKKALRQSGNADSTRDGMDIALCSFSSNLSKLEYAGANRPIWMIRKGSSAIEETRATKTAIGGLTEDDQEFTKHSFDLQSGDTVYIFSDGYADQFSPEDKKLMTRKFMELVLSVQNKSMEAQKQFLDEFIMKWKGEMEQTDDILVIGIRA